MPAMFPVQQPPEDASAVEARHAAPVDGAGPGDEGRGVAIADQRVVGDGWIPVRIVAPPGHRGGETTPGDGIAGKRQRGPPRPPRRSERRGPGGWLPTAGSYGGVPAGRIPRVPPGLRGPAPKG